MQKLIPQKNHLKGNFKNTILDHEIAFKRRKYWQLLLKPQKLIPQSHIHEDLQIAKINSAKINDYRVFEYLVIRPSKSD